MLCLTSILIYAILVPITNVWYKIVKVPKNREIDVSVKKI